VENDTDRALNGNGEGASGFFPFTDVEAEVEGVKKPGVVGEQLVEDVPELMLMTPSRTP
jgi:hypothetical protein